MLCNNANSFEFFLFLYKIQDTLMRKLTCKTLMEIIPSDTLDKVKKELEEKKLSSDFETVLGLVIAV